MHLTSTYSSEVLARVKKYRTSTYINTPENGSTASNLKGAELTILMTSQTEPFASNTLEQHSDQDGENTTDEEPDKY